MATDPVALRARVATLGLRAELAKAKGGRGGAQPRHPAGTSLGGQWAGSGVKGALSNLMGSVSGLFAGAKTLADPNWGQQQKYEPPHLKPSAKSVLHPARDDKGRAVHIHRPKTGTPAGQWKGGDNAVTIVPGQAKPSDLNGVPFKAVGTPGDWTKVWGQNPGAEKGLPDLTGHKYKHAAAGVIIREPDGRVWLTSPTNGFGGYRNTFPKGTQEPGLSLQQTAIKEAWEETGLKIKITGVLGDFERTTSVARYYVAERIGGDPTRMGWESQALRLSPPSALKSFLNMPVDRDIASLLWEERDLTKAREGWLTPDQIGAVNDLLAKAKGAAKGAAGGKGGAKTGHWNAQPRWPQGTPLGGQWKTYDGNGIPVVPALGNSQAAKGWGLKANAAYGLAASGDYAGVKQIGGSIIAAAEAKGWKAAGGNEGAKFKTAQYIKALIDEQGNLVAITAQATKLAGPEVLSSYKKTGAKPGGSNPGAVYTDGKGVKWLVKGANYPSDDRAKNEILTAKLMQAAGIAAPEMKLVDLGGLYGGGLGVAAQMVQLDQWSGSNSVHLAKAQADFAVHAWLANYDAVGQPAGDNLAMYQGKVFNYDPGGGLLYRAQGLPKALPGGMLGHTASEWSTMRDKATNAAAHSVYGSMTADQLKASAEKLKQVSDKTIVALVKAHGPGDDALKSKLVLALRMRRDDIVAKAAALGGAGAQTAAAPAPGPKPAEIKPQKGSGEAGKVFYKADLKNTEPGHDKFYRIEVKQGALGAFVVTAHWGKTGTAGQSMTKGSYTSQVSAVTAAKLLANEKKAKGYVGHEQTSAVVPQVAAAPAPKLSADLIGAKQWMDADSKAAFAKLTGLLAGGASLDQVERQQFIDMANQISGLGPKGGGEAANTLNAIAFKLAAPVLAAAHPANGLGQTVAAMTALTVAVANQLGDEAQTAIAPYIGAVAPAAAPFSALAGFQHAYGIALNDYGASNTIVLASKQAVESMDKAAANGNVAQIDSHIASAKSLSKSVMQKDLLDAVAAYGEALKAAMPAKAPVGAMTAAEWTGATGGMAKVPVSALSAKPTINFMGVPDSAGVGAGVKTYLAVAANAMNKGDLASLQQAYDKLAGFKAKFPLGSKGRMKVASAQAWVVANATQHGGLKVEGGVFSPKTPGPVPTGDQLAAMAAKVNDPSGTADALKDRAKSLLQSTTGFIDDSLTTTLGSLTYGALSALHSGNDKALASAIGTIALSGFTSSQELAEKLTAMAEAKGGFPMTTGAAATVTGVGGVAPEPAPPPAAKPDMPAMPAFQETTGSAVPYYQGKVGSMNSAYAKGDIAALQKLGTKPNGSGPLWPTFKSGSKAGQPKGINAELMAAYHSTLVKNLVDHQSATVAAKLDEQAKVVAPGDNAPGLPAMPKFGLHKIADTNSNAGAHNGKVAAIEALAAKGDVKGILALNYGTNTYGKKQASLANDALAAMGSPFQVDIGQKKHSHPALTGGVTAAAAAKSGALTDKELPPKLDFMNWNGAGKGLSSSANVNQSNQAAYDQLTALAKAGDFNGLKNFTYQPINKETGAPAGPPVPISQHPSQHVKGHQEYLLQAIDEKLNPPKPLEIFEAKQAAASIAKLAEKFPPKPLGITSKKVPSSQAIGHYIAIGQVKGVEHLIPKKQQAYGPAQSAQAKQDYHLWAHDTKAQSFRQKVQGSGGYAYHGGWDSPDQKAKGHYTGADLTAEAKAAHKWARKQPPGTKVHKWENLTTDMKAKLEAAQPGLILQNPAPTCASKSATSTKGFGPNHRWNIIYTEGAKGLDSFASGSHPSEQEVTMLPNHRFMIVSHVKASGHNSFAETTVLLLPPDPALDSDGYTTGYGYGKG